MKITKSKLAQIVQEELSNTMSEMETWKMGRSMKADDLAADPLYAAENKGIVDAQDDFARIQAGGKVLQIDTTEETEEEEIAYAQAYHKTMDRLKQNVADRKLYRPPPPETDADREASDAELDFEATYSEGMMDAIKNKLSPKRPTATAPRKRSENGNEKMYQMGVEDAEDAMHISGDYRESPSSDDEDYMAGWNDTIQGANSALQEGTSKMKITKSKLAQIVQEELNNTMLEGLMLEQQNVEKAAELAANMKDTPEVEAIFATLDKDPEAQKALKSILAQLPDENIEEASAGDSDGGIVLTAGFLMVGNTMYHVAAGKALMGAVIAAGLPIAAGLTGLALVALAIRYVKSKKKKAEWAADDAAWNALSPQEKEARRNALRDGKPLNEGKKITKSALAQIVQEEVAAIKSEGYKSYKRDDISGFELGRQHALAVSQGEMDEDDTWLKRMRDEAYGAGFDDAMKELDPQSSWDDEGGFDNDDMYENKITKSKLAQIIKEELKATLSEDGSGYSWGMRPPPKAEPSVDEAAADSGVQQMIYDYIEDNLENGPLSLDNILTLTQPTADDAYASLEDIWEEVLEAAIEELELAEEIVRVQDWNDPSSLPRWTI